MVRMGGRDEDMFYGTNEGMWKDTLGASRTSPFSASFDVRREPAGATNNADARNSTTPALVMNTDEISAAMAMAATTAIRGAALRNRGERRSRTAKGGGKDPYPTKSVRPPAIADILRPPAVSHWMENQWVGLLDRDLRSNPS